LAIREPVQFISTGLVEPLYRVDAAIRTGIKSYPIGAISQDLCADGVTELSTIPKKQFIALQYPDWIIGIRRQTRQLPVKKR
jgi:hypothetical protein